MLSSSDPAAENDDPDDMSASDFSSPVFSSTISKPGEAFRAGVVGSVSPLRVALEKVNSKPLLTASKLC
jgi:hypothetical protein